jgi:hypothetical protein
LASDDNDLLGVKIKKGIINCFSENHHIIFLNFQFYKLHNNVLNIFSDSKYMNIKISMKMCFCEALAISKKKKRRRLAQHHIGA